jgi:hypothetical protein
MKYCELFHIGWIPVMSASYYKISSIGSIQHVLDDEFLIVFLPANKRSKITSRACRKWTRVRTVVFYIRFQFQNGTTGKWTTDFRARIRNSSGAGLMLTSCILFKGFGYDFLFLECVKRLRITVLQVLLFGSLPLIVGYWKLRLKMLIKEGHI